MSQVQIDPPASVPPSRPSYILMIPLMRRADRLYSLDDIRYIQAYKPVGVWRGDTCWYSITDCPQPHLSVTAIVAELELTGLAGQGTAFFHILQAVHHHMMIHWYSHCVNDGVVTSVRCLDHPTKSDLMRYVALRLSFRHDLLTILRLMLDGLYLFVVPTMELSSWAAQWLTVPIQYIRCYSVNKHLLKW